MCAFVNLWFILVCLFVLELLVFFHYLKCAFGDNILFHEHNRILAEYTPQEYWAIKYKFSTRCYMGMEESAYRLRNLARQFLKHKIGQGGWPLAS